MFGIIKSILGLTDPQNLILVVKAFNEIKEAVDAILRVVKIITNGNGSDELNEELDKIPDRPTKTPGE